MHNVGKLFHLHETVHFDRLGSAHPVHIIAGQINQHNMLCPILE